MKSKAFPTFLSFLLCPLTVLVGQTFLNEQFPEDGRTTIDFPNTTAWRLQTNAVTTMDQSTAGQLFLDTGAADSGSRTFFSYITGSPNISLAVGEALRVRVGIAFTDFGGARQVRMGLFNHNVALGDRIDTDNLGTISSWGGIQGYGTFVNPRDENTDPFTTYSLRKRVASGSALLSTGSNWNDTNFVGADGGGFGLELNEFYRITLLVNRINATEVSFTVSMHEGSTLLGSATRIDQTGSPYTTFNMFGLWLNGGNSGVTLNEFEVSVIPEPAHVGLALGLLGLVGGILRKRYRR